MSLESRKLRGKGYPSVAELREMCKTKEKTRQEDTRIFLQNVEKIQDSPICDGYESLLVSNYVEEISQLANI